MYMQKSLLSKCTGYPIYRSPGVRRAVALWLRGSRNGGLGHFTWHPWATGVLQRYVTPMMIGYQLLAIKGIGYILSISYIIN